MTVAINEIVQVYGNGVLIDSASRLRSYATGSRRKLTPGFYLVLWTGGRDSSRASDRQARYFGPLPSRAIAEKLKTSAFYLGVIEPGGDAPAHAANASETEEGEPAAAAPAPSKRRHSRDGNVEELHSWLGGKKRKRAAAVLSVLHCVTV